MAYEHGRLSPAVDTSSAHERVNRHRWLIDAIVYLNRRRLLEAAGGEGRHESASRFFSYTRMYHCQLYVDEHEWAQMVDKNERVQIRDAPELYREARAGK